MTANLGLWAAADLMWTLHYNHMDDPPYPNLADVLYLATYPFASVGLVLLCGPGCGRCARRCGSTAPSAA